MFRSPRRKSAKNTKKVDTPEAIVDRFLKRKHEEAEALRAKADELLGPPPKLEDRALLQGRRSMPEVLAPPPMTPLPRDALNPVRGRMGGELRSLWPPHLGAAHAPSRCGCGRSHR